jgi:hypothetical protein
VSAPPLPRSLPRLNASLADLSRETRQAQLETQSFVKHLSDDKARRAERVQGYLHDDTSTSSVDLTSWVSLGIDTPGTWLLRVHGIYTTAAAGTGLQHAFDFDGAYTSGRLRLVNFTDAAGTHDTRNTSARGAKIGLAGVGTAGNSQPFWLSGFFEFASAGTFSLLFASGVAASAVTLRSGVLAEMALA